VKYHPNPHPLHHCPPRSLLLQKQFLSPLGIKDLLFEKYARIFLKSCVARIKLRRLYPHVPSGYMIKWVFTVSMDVEKKGVGPDLLGI
jgi:hypothetical protein